MRFRSTFKYATSDFTDISKSSSIKKAACGSPFQKLLDLEMPVRSSVLYLNYYVQIQYEFYLAGNMYLKGQAVEENYKTALQYFQKGVKKGKYCSYCGCRYKFVSLDKTTLAFLSLSHSRPSGDATAELSLAHCYSHGKGVTEDLAKAFEYHASAAEKGMRKNNEFQKNSNKV